MTQEIPEGAEWFQARTSRYARRCKQDPAFIERWDPYDLRWKKSTVSWTDAELEGHGYTRVSSTSGEQPFTRDNLPADALWVTVEPTLLCVAKLDLRKNALVFLYPGDRSGGWKLGSGMWSLEQIEADPRWKRIEREPQDQPAAEIERPYGVRLSDSSGIAEFVPPPLPEPKAEPKPRVSTLNRAWRWLAG